MLDVSCIVNCDFRMASITLRTVWLTLRFGAGIHCPNCEHRGGVADEMFFALGERVNQPPEAR